MLTVEVPNAGPVVAMPLIAQLAILHDGWRAGWVAIGDHPYRMGEAAGGYGWLRGRPYRRIGKSIRLYWIRPGG